MTNEISQPVARAMQAALQHVARSYRLTGNLSPADMKVVWNALDICAREQERFLYARDVDFLAEFETAPMAVAAE